MNNKKLLLTTSAYMLSVHGRTSDHGVRLYKEHLYQKNSVSKSKNKWSVVQIYDVGVVYGRTYRKKMKEYKSQAADTEEIV